MGLSRLDNFLKNIKGEIIYVDSNNIDATDSIENQGNSLARPFKTLQRALIEAARFSYQGGIDNDRFAKTTILLYPGDHYVDNRPGWIPTTANNFLLRGGVSSTNFVQFSSSSNFDLSNELNDLYKLNSICGGIIVPRGTSIVGMDLRKTKIIPRYVPNPENDDIERSAIFRVTGACYFWQFSVLDADVNEFCYKDYTTNKFTPNFSHHKLTAFEYADGINPVVINDNFATYSTERTDLEMYYEKIGLAFGISSGRDIPNDYPSVSIDIQPRVEEYRIVGTRSGEVGISSIRAGDGINSSTLITAILSQPLEEIDVDVIIKVDGINSPGYDGEHAVVSVISPTELQYNVSTPPLDPNPSTSGSTLNVIIDTVSSASPYIFNCSLRSVYGLCGMHADGSKATGFKSMVVAQFTGIGLQKDNNAFVKYNESTGLYDDTTTFGNENIHTDSRARFKPSYENYHIKCSNDGYIQVVSVFAIGYANHFLAESGGDQSINNSNSNFGAKALVSSGFRLNAFPKDDVGYITHIIPPEQLKLDENSIEFYSIDVAKTITSGNVTKLYIYGETNQNIIPEDTYQGYKIGAKNNDKLNLIIGNSTYSAKIVMPNTETNTSKSARKENTVALNVGINSISNNIFTFTSAHDFITGESVKVYSDNGNLPIGLEADKIYYAIKGGNGISDVNYQIKLAQNLNDALNDNEITVGNNGGILKFVSRVSDKNPGDIGHPIQFDSSQNNWYLNVSANTSENNLISAISSNSSSLGAATPRTFFRRTIDNRNLNNRIYQVRYILPADSPFTARPPLEGYVIQESNNTIGVSDSEVEKALSLNNLTLNNSTELRNFRIISNATWSQTTTSGIATFTTELPHDLLVGSQVEVVSVASTNNTSATNNLGFNGLHTVAGISTNYNEFSVEIPIDPGSFVGSSSLRVRSAPRFKKKTLNNTTIIYRSEEIQEYVKGEQDGIYNLTLLNTSNSPEVDPFTDLKFLQPVLNLYPQFDRDNPISDPKQSKSYALSDTLGKVVLDNPENSETKESLNKAFLDFGINKKIKSISQTATPHVIVIETEKNHGFNPITSVSVVNSGSGYGTGVSGSFYGAKLSGGDGADATALISVNNSGQITQIKIINGGSDYAVGNILTVTGISTFAPFASAQVQVNSIYNHQNEVIEISGVNHEKYNTLAKIDSVDSSNKITVHLDNSSYHSIIESNGSLNVSESSLSLIGGKSVQYTSASVDTANKTITLALNGSNPFKVNDVVRISNNASSGGLFNPQNTVKIERNFIVKSTASNTITVFYGNLSSPDEISTSFSPGSINFVCSSGFSSKVGSVEEINQRLVPIYGGKESSLQASVLSKTTDQITIANLQSLNLNIGDYLQINNEIVRIKSTVPSTGNLISVFRGVLGSNGEIHSSGSIVRKINPLPIELRRNSLIRASAHTFEYIGFGPGNYSTAFPEKQDRKLSSDEEKLSHSVRTNGGISVFSSMNADGNFYIGNTKINSASGKEETFDIPVPSFVGENDYNKTGYNIIEGDKLSISKSIKIEGGKNSKDLSEFNGPVLFSDKVTSTSIKGLEAISVFLQGDETISRKYTVSATQPTLSGNPGDIVFKSNPADKKEIGWIYTAQNQWELFGSAAGVKLTPNESGTSTHYLTFSDQYSTVDEIEILNTSNKVTFQPSTGRLTAQSFSGDGTLVTNIHPQALKPKSEDKASFQNYLYETRKSFTIPSGNTTISSSGTYGDTVFTSLGQIVIPTNSTLTVSTGTKFKVSQISGIHDQDSSSQNIEFVGSRIQIYNNGTIGKWLIGQKGGSDSPNYYNDAFTFTTFNVSNNQFTTIASISQDGLFGINTIETMYTAPSGSIDKLQSLQVRPRPGENGTHVSIVAADSRGPAELRVWNKGTLAEWLIGQRSEVKSDFTVSKLLSGTVTEMLSVSTDGVVGIHTVTNMLGVPSTNIDVLQALQVRSRPGQTGTHLSIIGTNSSPTELRVWSGNAISEWLVGQRPEGIAYDYSAFRISRLVSGAVTTMLSVSSDGIVGINTVTNMDGVSNSNIDVLQALQVRSRPGQTGTHLSIIGTGSSPTELRIWSGNNISEWLVGQRPEGTVYDQSAFRVSRLASGSITTMLSVSSDGIVGINTVTNMDGVSLLNIDSIQALQIKPRPGRNSVHVSILGSNSGDTGLRIWNGNNVSEWLVGQRILDSNFTISTLASQVITTRLTISTTGTVTASAFSPTSDINLKTNINEINSALDIINNIRGVSFEWKETNEKSLGVIAQEIEVVLPELVGEEEGIKNVNYNGIVAVLIECVKEQQKQIEELKTMIKNL